MTSDRTLKQAFNRNIKIGYGFKGIDSRISKGFLVAFLLLIAVFTADTWTTFSAGIEVRLDDLNPLIRNISPTIYILSAIVRGVISAFLLIWFWPGKLVYRFSDSQIWALILPFAYRETLQYFGASLVLIIIPIKAIAAWNNLQVLSGQVPALKPSLTIISGLFLGVFFSNLMLYIQYRSCLKNDGKNSGSSDTNDNGIL